MYMQAYSLANCNHVDNIDTTLTPQIKIYYSDTVVCEDIME